MEQFQAHMQAQFRACMADSGFKIPKLSNKRKREENEAQGAVDDPDEVEDLDIPEDYHGDDDEEGENNETPDQSQDSLMQDMDKLMNGEEGADGDEGDEDDELHHMEQYYSMEEKLGAPLPELMANVCNVFGSCLMRLIQKNFWRVL